MKNTLKSKIVNMRQEWSSNQVFKGSQIWRIEGILELPKIFAISWCLVDIDDGKLALVISV